MWCVQLHSLVAKIASFPFSFGIDHIFGEQLHLLPVFFFFFAASLSRYEIWMWSKDFASACSSTAGLRTSPVLFSVSFLSLWKLDQKNSPQGCTMLRSRLQSVLIAMHPKLTTGSKVAGASPKYKAVEECQSGHWAQGVCGFAVKHSSVSFVSLLREANAWRRKLHQGIIFFTPLSFPCFSRTGGHYTVAEMCQHNFWRGVIGCSKCNNFMFCITKVAAAKQLVCAHGRQLYI